MTKIFEDTESDRTAILKHFNRTPETIKVDIETVKTWMDQQPHLPKISIGDKRIEKFLILNKMSVEKAKEKIDMYFSIRKSMPEIFIGKEPSNIEVSEAAKQLYWYPLPKLTEDKERIYFFQIKETDPDKIDPINYAAHALNVTDYTLEKEANITAIGILDLKHASFKGAKRASPTLCKKIIYIFENVYSCRLKMVHLINAPPLIDVVVNVIKGWVKPKLASRVQIHDSLESLYKQVPKEYLPAEYGGREKSMDEIHEMFTEELKNHVEWLQILNKAVIKDNLRPTKPKDDDILGFHGNFRQLSFD